MSLFARSGRLPPFPGILPIQNCDLDFPEVTLADLKRVLAGSLKGWTVDFKLSPDVDNGYYTVTGDSELRAKYKIIKSPCNQLNCQAVCTPFGGSSRNPGNLAAPLSVNFNVTAKFVQTSTFEYVSPPNSSWPFQTCSSVSLQVGFYRDKQHRIRMLFYCVCTSFTYPYYSWEPMTQVWIYTDSGGDNSRVYGFSVPSWAGAIWAPWAPWQPVTDLGTTAGPTILGVNTLQGGYQLNNMYGGNNPPETEMYNPTVTIEEIPHGNS
jgi:hypothetical protein